MHCVEREGLIGFTTVKAIVNVATDAEVQSSHARKFSELFAARQRRASAHTSRRVKHRIPLKRLAVILSRHVTPLKDSTGTTSGSKIQAKMRTRAS